MYVEQFYTWAHNVFDWLLELMSHEADNWEYNTASEYGR